MPPDNTNVYYALVLILVTEIEMRDGKKPTQTLQGNDRQCLRPAMAFTIKGANPEQAGGRPNAFALASGGFCQGSATSALA
jgi:hypothetical protein